MYQDIIATITSSDDAVRNRTEDELLGGKGKEDLLRMAEGLEFFRKHSDNLYHRVRACLFIHAIYRYYLIDRRDVPKLGLIPYPGIRAAFNREYDEAIERFRAAMMSQGCNEALLSALAEAYYCLAFKYLINQVRQSVRTSRGNEWLFAPRTLKRYPLHVPKDYLAPDPATGLYPIGRDVSPVRADPSHAGWSDIFFLGMDFPEGAKVVNMSIDLAVHGQGEPVPPCECYCRCIAEPIIRLVSLDLKCEKEIRALHEIFDFGSDHLALLKAGVIASGIIPPCVEGSDITLQSLLKKLLGRTGGFELVTCVRDIPKGSRLAVSTTLLATIITRLMRFSGQIDNQQGGLTEDERRLVASRAILGEWLGGSGGGWQDSGGIWPGIKIIEGVEAGKDDPEHGISRGRLLPAHTVLAREQLPQNIEELLATSIVMVHGGLSLNVGPILEMVTTRYLLRYREEWKARLQGYEYFDDIVAAIKSGNMKSLGRLVTQDWESGTKIIIPWTTNAFTEDLIDAVKKRFAKDYWGFLMLGGASGGGMAFIVNPKAHAEFRDGVLAIMRDLKRRYEYALPFAMDPVVYDFRLNYKGIDSRICASQDALMPEEYYARALNAAVRNPKSDWCAQHAAEVQALAQRHNATLPTDAAQTARALLDACMPHAKAQASTASSDDIAAEAERIKTANGFDPVAHERNRHLLKSGAIGTGKNRMPETTDVEDVRAGDVGIVSNDLDDAEVMRFRLLGQELLRKNAVAVVTYGGGLGSRWTEGAAVVKVINPFVTMKGRHRSFAEIHLGKTCEVKGKYDTPVQHVLTTSYLTHDPLRHELELTHNYGYDGPVYLSPGRSIAHRVYPMERDLRFLWEELAQQRLDDQAQKVVESLHEAYIQWARVKGEGEDYIENVPIQRFNPPGHFFEVPNMLRNGVLASMLKDNPALEHLMVHNADTLGVFLSPIMLGMHHANGKTINFEVTPRRYEDKGGGLARVNSRVQIVEALALPREEDEFKLTYYNTLTNWININQFLAALGLTRDDIIGAEKDKVRREKINAALHALEERVPTYVTIKEVKLLWGAGQEDVLPVAQFEKLWGDMTWLPEFECGFFAVERRRGQQLKDPAQLDRWVRDGSRDYVASKARFAR